MRKENEVFGSRARKVLEEQRKTAQEEGRFHRGDVPGALMKDFRGVARAVPWWLGLLQERREADTAHTDNNTESQTTLAVNRWPGQSDRLLAAATHLL